MACSYELSSFIPSKGIRQRHFALQDEVKMLAHDYPTVWQEQQSSLRRMARAHREWPGIQCQTFVGQLSLSCSLRPSALTTFHYVANFIHPRSPFCTKSQQRSVKPSPRARMIDTNSQTKREW